MDRQSLDTYEIVVSEAQVRERIVELGRQISHDYQGRVVNCVGVMEDGFLFVADLVREITCDVRCQFITPFIREVFDHERATTEIHYAPELNVQDQHVLLCVGIVSTGLTIDFLIRNLQARGAASIAICGLLERPSDRRVSLDIAYCGFQLGPQWVAGFGLGTPTLSRNLPFIFAAHNLHG